MRESEKNVMRKVKVKTSDEGSESENKVMRKVRVETK